MKLTKNARLELTVESFGAEGEGVCRHEGMAVFVPIYRLLGKIPFVRNISNRIVVLERQA